MPEEIMLECQQCGEPFAIRVGQSATFICPACEGHKTVARVRSALSQATQRSAGDSPFILLGAMVPFCSLGGLALVASGGYLALTEASGLVGGVTWIALGILNLMAGQAGAALLAIERRSRMTDGAARETVREHRSRRHSRRRRRTPDSEPSFPNGDE